MDETFDIAVAGGGVSGVVAALAAARLGARVALVEARTRLGGVAVLRLHRFVCGLFACDGDRPGEMLHGAAVAAFCRRLAGGDPAARAVRRGRVWLLPFNGGEALAACAAEAAADEHGLRLLLGQAVTGVSCEGGRVTGLRLASGATLAARAVIDCTGEAAVCRLAGADVVWPERPALGGYGFEVCGVAEAVDAGAPALPFAVPLALRREVQTGRLPPHLAFTTYEPAEPGRAWIKLAVPNGDAERARADAEAVFAVLRGLPAFREARLVATASQVAARETCHLCGAYTLTGGDVLAARKFADAVARDAWPLERWDPVCGVRYRYLPEGCWCDIPLRCLRPARGPENLLCAGAALSADGEAAASVRVMGVAMATGEAAATAAFAHVQNRA